MIINPINPASSNRKPPAALTRAMGQFIGQPVSGLSGIIPFRQPDTTRTVFYNFRNPLTGE